MPLTLTHVRGLFESWVFTVDLLRCVPLNPDMPGLASASRMRLINVKNLPRTAFVIFSGDDKDWLLVGIQVEFPFDGRKNQHFPVRIQHILAPLVDHLYQRECLREYCWYLWTL